MRSKLIVAVFSLIMVFALACGTSIDEQRDSSSSAQSSTAVESDKANPTASQEDSAAYARPDEIPLIKGPKSPDGYQAIFATPDLGVGDNRVAVVVTSPTGLVRSPGATFSSVFFADGSSEGQRRETTLAVFREFPLGTRGLYSALINFDRPGKWGLEIAVLDESGTGHQIEIAFDVAEKASAPALGDPAIPSRNKTIADVDRLSQLTTGSLQDSDLYQLTIANALSNGKPTVVVMASPAFCTNAVCGPQVDVLSELEDEYGDRANFIHVDFYDNPEEIQGDLNNTVLSPTVKEWNLPSTEWSFVIDAQGIVQARFESFVGYSELERALVKLLG